MDFNSIRNDILAHTADVLCGGKSIAHFRDEAEIILRQSLKIDHIRRAVVANRIQRALNNKSFNFYPNPMNSRELRGKSAIEHNLAGLFNDCSSARSARLIRPLSVIEHGRPLSLLNRAQGSLTDIDFETNSKVLSIGPRTEAELLMLWAYGYKLENIKGADLISYSPLIDLVDMHNMPYNDNSFNVIVCSCTLVYSTDVDRAIKEIKRVGTSDCLFAFMFHVSDKQYIKTTEKMVGRDIASRNAIAYSFFENPDIFYSHFCSENLNLLNGTSSACIFKNRSILVD